MNNVLTINPEQEKQTIVTFLKETFAKNNKENAVIGLSGGVDSATSFHLLKEFLDPEHIFVMHLYYDESFTATLDGMLKSAGIPDTNIKVVSIKESVETLALQLQLPLSDEYKLRRGNITARIRMIMLFDYAKANNALVVGTENKSENLLGYFTRFGDQASDIEPIEHLYKTQVYQLAQYIGVPEAILTQPPSAGLWQGQTDEGQFGFTYEEADQVLSLAGDQKKSLREIEKLGFPNAEKILAWRDANIFKQQTPYTLT